MTTRMLVRTAAGAAAAVALAGIVCTSTARAGNTDPQAPNAAARADVCANLGYYHKGRRFEAMRNVGGFNHYVVDVVTDTPQYTRLTLGWVNQHDQTNGSVVMTCG